MQEDLLLFTTACLGC